jgi:hypothetical protein
MVFTAPLKRIHQGKPKMAKKKKPPQGKDTIDFFDNGNIIQAMTGLVMSVDDCKKQVDVVVKDLGFNAAEPDNSQLNLKVSTTDLATLKKAAKNLLAISKLVQSAVKDAKATAKKNRKKKK